MRAVVQRVSEAEVTVNDQIVGNINEGLVILLGVGKNDTEHDSIYLADKIINLRIFDDEKGKMNLSLLDTGGSAMVVSQFTLFGDCRKGRRPSYNDAASPEHAEKLYEYFVDKIKTSNIKVATGIFQAMMKINLANDGPVTILIDSRKDF